VAGAALSSPSYDENNGAEVMVATVIGVGVGILVGIVIGVGTAIASA